MPPASWIVQHASWLPATGRALDLACGRGRHAIWLAERGLAVHAIDRDHETLDALSRDARERGLSIDVECVDLEEGSSRLTPSSYDVIVVTHYLHRPLMASIVNALRPGGLLIYETFTIAQAARGKPTNPDFLLRPGELARLVAPLEILAAREGTYEARDVASIVARRSVSREA